MNELEKALLKSDEEINIYLSEVSPKEFREHIADIQSKYADKSAIHMAIENLQKLLK